MDFKNKKVLVTGGAGFIGSELVRQLASLGARVTVVDNLVNGKRENLDGVFPDRVRLLKADIRDDARVRKAMKGSDAVYHLATMGVRHSIHAPFENHEVNATGSLKLLLNARAAKVGKFVYVSSSEVYGTGVTVPMTEDHPTVPHTVYGSGKLAGECYARAFHKTYGYPTVVVRPFNAFGPRSHHEGDSGEVIPKFLLRCMAGQPMVVFGNGRQTRDFTYVSDTARGILLAGTSPKAVGRTLNIGQGKEITVEDLAKTVRKVLGKPRAAIRHDRPRPGDVLRLYADTTLARRLLGYAPKVSLREGLEGLLDWYRASGKSPLKLLEQDRLYNWVVPTRKP